MAWKLVSDPFLFAKNCAKPSKMKTLKQSDCTVHVIDSSDSFLQGTL